MGLLALAIAPGIAICIYIYLKDKFNREPLGLLIMSFILGMLSIIPALILELAFGKPIDQLGGQSMAYVALFAYGVVALSEEGSKLLVVRLYCYPRKAFDDPFDGIIYSVMVGMGFATLENIGYVMQNGYANGVLRMFLSVPGHATFAVIMGYFVSLAKFDAANRKLYFFLALVCPVIFHGTFDFFLFLQSNLLHICGALVSFVIAVILSRKAIKRRQALSQSYVKPVVPPPANDILSL